jgi:hypothetical protein
MQKSESQNQSEHMIKPLFNSEMEWLYFHLWKKSSSYNFKIPDTIFVKQK